MASVKDYYTPAEPAEVYASPKTLLDAVALDAAVNTLYELDGETTAFVRPILSAGGATVAVVVVLYEADGTLIGLAAPGVQVATASAYSAAAAAQDYHAPILAFDLGGAGKYEVRSAAASSGTRALTTWAV